MGDKSFSELVHSDGFEVDFLAASPSVNSLDFDYPDGHESPYESFFLDQYLSTDQPGDGAADHPQQLQQEDLAPPHLTETFNLQPTAGASTSGCDARGIAVGFH